MTNFCHTPATFTDKTTKMETTKMGAARSTLTHGPTAPAISAIAMERECVMGFMVYASIPQVALIAHTHRRFARATPPQVVLEQMFARRGPAWALPV
jgi:hypothetical protein